MSKNLRALQARKAAAVNAMRAITEKATAEAREPTEDELKAYDGHKTEIATIVAATAREQEMVDLERTTAAVGSVVQIPDGAGLSVSDNLANDPRLGFKSLGEFAGAVFSAGNKSQPRMHANFAAAPSLFTGEGVGADGGFLVPPQFAREVFTLSQTEDNLLPMTDSIDIEGNAMSFPKDETTPWGTDGVRAYWQAEAAAATATKIKLGLTELKLRKLLALVPVTDELLADQAALNGYLPSKLADSIRWKTNEAFMFGTGAGLPQGAFTSGAVITVAKETGQAASTLLIQNVAKMISRLPAGSYPRSTWMINNDVLPALFTLVIGNYPAYIPASEGAKSNPYGTLLGRPIVISQHAKAFSAEGDVLLADWKYYRAITKAAGIEMATSLHLYFDADATAFRASFRVDGQSKIAAAISPANGSTTMSPFIQLGAR